MTIETRNWTRHIEQIVYYESSMFPDIKFKNLKSARVAELCELLKNQACNGGLSGMSTDLFQVLIDTMNDKVDTVFFMSEEFKKLKEETSNENN